MASCATLLQNKIDSNDIDSITSLISNVRMPLNISRTIKQLFKLEISKIDTAVFNIELYSNNPIGNVGVTITIYYYNTENNTITSVGNIYITEMMMSFQKDFTPGTFFICISSSYNTYYGFLTGIFAGYIPQARMHPRFYSGERLSTELTKTFLQPTCNQPLRFELVDGSLPPGIRLNAIGHVEGLIPDMDCIEENSNLPPSFNWFYHNENEWGSWSKRWLFKVRTWIPHLGPIIIADAKPICGETCYVDYLITASINDPEIYEMKTGELLNLDLYVKNYWGPEAFELFCLNVFNNWSKDKDHFDDLPPEQIIETNVPCVNKYVIPQKDPSCCEEPPNKKDIKFVPQVIVTPCPCETTSSEEEYINSFIRWYRENANKESYDHIKTFIDSFKSSPLYDRLMEETGLINETISQQEKARTQFEQERQDMLNTQIEGRNTSDIDYIILIANEMETSKLPITIYCQIGSTLELELIGD